MGDYLSKGFQGSSLKDMFPEGLLAYNRHEIDSLKKISCRLFEAVYYLGHY